MIANTLSLGTVAVTYTRRGEIESRSSYSVGGLTPNTAKTLVFSHETSQSGKKIRTLVDTTRQFVDPGSVTGQVRPVRVYTIIERPDFVSPTDVKVTVDEHRSILANTAGIIDPLLNLEV
jgi:hypothetical protein